MTPYERALRTLLSSTTRPKLGLERMAALLSRLGDPQQSFRAMHVAGTKGKGSTSAFAASMCRAAGLRTGLTTSPHLSTARERIIIDDAMIDEDAFVSLAGEVEHAAADLDASFFEKMIAMALLAFARASVDVAVVEVGLGGRLDATNLVVPSACAITRLGLDHTEHLGPTLEHIAREKAGILKPGVPAAVAPQDERALEVIVEVGARVAAPLIHVEPDPSLHPSLAGVHQLENASVAAALVRAGGLGVRDDDIRRGVARTTWPGRYETLRDAPVLVVDGAHNATSAAALCDTALADPRLRGDLTLIVGMTSGHDALAFARELAPLRPRRVLAVASRSPRTQSARDVARALARVFVAVEETQLDRALEASGPALVTGSLYLVGEARERVRGAPADPAFPLY